MKLAEDHQTAAWLESFKGVADEFEWDEANRTKHRKHSVEPNDVEAIFNHPILFAGRIIEPLHDELRWMTLGQDDSGRRLALIFTRRRNRLRAVSCRPMRRKEKQLYEKAITDVEKNP